MRLPLVALGLILGLVLLVIGVVVLLEGLPLSLVLLPVFHVLHAFGVHTWNPFRRECVVCGGRRVA